MAEYYASLRDLWTYSQTRARETERRRQQAVQGIHDDPVALWSNVGPVVPVVVPGLTYPVLGDTGKLGFDLNAAGMAELEAARIAPPDAERIVAERDRLPFKDHEDAHKRLDGDLGPLKTFP